MKLRYVLASVLFAAGCATTPREIDCGCMEPPEETPAGEAGAQEQAARRDPLAHGQLTAPAASVFPNFAAASLRPSELTLVHETRASARFDGAAFHAQGRPLDERAKTWSVSDGGELPASFQREDDGVMHMPSGLSCPDVMLGQEDEKTPLRLASVVQFDEKGLDVGCDYLNGEAGVTYYSSRYPGMSLEDHAASAVGSIRQRFKSTKPVSVPIIAITDKQNNPIGDEPIIAGGFEVGDINGKPYKTGLWLARSGDWHFKMRATYPAKDSATEISAAISFALTFLMIDIHLDKQAEAAGV
jgi:hypothetical protein